MAKEKTREELELELNERTRFVKLYCITHDEMREQSKRIERIRTFLGDLDMKKIHKIRGPQVIVRKRTAEEEEQEKQELLKLIDSV